MSDTTIQPTVVANMGALLAALHAKQQALGWSNQFVRDVSGIDVAEVFEKGRRPSVAVIDALMSLFAVSLAVVPDPQKASVLSDWWSGDRSERAEPFRGRERARRAALARWRGTTPEQRSAVARHAVMARWKERRNAETAIAR
jgi:hypothetical protein